MTAPLPALSRLGRAALAYGARGWPIVPLHHATDGRCSCGRECGSEAKHPRTNRGFLDASTDPAQITAWWRQWPEANIGFRPGTAALVVIDVDGPVGEEHALQLGLLAEPTLEVVTGRADGGRHRYYRHPGGGAIANAVLAPKLDVRADAGYVLLPPSVHASGRVYRWLGRFDELADLPPTIAARLTSAPADGERPKADALPAWMIPWLEVGEGGRNTTLTRFVGWAFAQGHDIATVQAMAFGVNASWPDPLGRGEVEAVVKSIAAKEARKPKRETPTGRILTLNPEPAPEPEPIRPAALAQAQLDEAIARGRMDFSGAPRWKWHDLDDLVGPMMPGELIVVGALTGNGKTAFLMSQMDFAAERRVPVLYLGMEKTPLEMRRHWAAWRLGFDWEFVYRNQWHRLPEGAQEAHEAMMAEQAERFPTVQFPPGRRVDISTLMHWVKWGVAEYGARLVMIDHLHRMDFGKSNNFRVDVTEVARSIADLATSEQVTILAAAQLNKHGAEQLDRCMPPALGRLKESAGFSEEAHLVLMLSRRLKESVDNDTLRALRQGLMLDRDVEMPNTMAVTCRKERVTDKGRDRTILLHVERGRVLDRAPDWREHAFGTANPHG